MILVAADDGQRALAIQMAAYHARVVDKARINCVVATPDTPRTAAATKHVVMNTPSMHNSAASATHDALAEVTEATGSLADTSSEPAGEHRSLLTRHSTTDVDRRRYQPPPPHQLDDLQSV